MRTCRSKRSTRLGITQALTFPQDCFAGIVQILTKLRRSVICIGWHELNATGYVGRRCALEDPYADTERDRWGSAASRCGWIIRGRAVTV